MRGVSPISTGCSLFSQSASLLRKEGQGGELSPLAPLCKLYPLTGIDVSLWKRKTGECVSERGRNPLSDYPPSQTGKLAKSMTK
jgi:hypothetical protein